MSGYGCGCFFIELGHDVHIIGGSLTDAVNEGVRRGYDRGYLCKSMVLDPVFDRKNTGDNTPAIIHADLGPEAIYTPEVEDFPCIVVTDIGGNDLYINGPEKYARARS